MNRERILAGFVACASLLVTAGLYNGMSASTDKSATKIAARDALRRGINILGYDGVWEGGVDAPFEMRDFDRIRAAGFDHVRVNFFGLRFMNAAGKLDPKTLSRLDHVLDEAAARGLAVVLDQHENKDCQLAKPDCAPRLVAFWRQISSRYRGARPGVVYEILNEPGGHMTAEQWNETFTPALAAIRESDPERPVIVAALNGDDPNDIHKLSLPMRDRNLIVTVHYYAPMTFTHQGAPWSQEFARLRDIAWGALEDRRVVDKDFALVAGWAESNDRPIYLGEFGVYDAAPAEAKAAWLAYVSQQAERLGWGWAVWQFDHDFSLFDHGARAWRQNLLHALTGNREVRQPFR